MDANKIDVTFFLLKKKICREGMYKVTKLSNKTENSN